MLRTDYAEMRISTEVGDIVLQVPWLATEDDLFLCETLLMNQIKAVRAHAKKRDLRHEKWLKLKEFAP